MQGVVEKKRVQEEQIERYVSQLVQAHKEAKEDIAKILKLQKEGISIPQELYIKYEANSNQQK